MPKTVVEEAPPYFAMGVYADSSVLEHFSGLLISSRNERRGEGERREREEWTGDGRRVYYA